MAHFAAEGGFRVSAVRTAENEIREVCVYSGLGGVCTMAHPWPDRSVVVKTSEGIEVAHWEDGTPSHISFDTQAHRIYTPDGY